jgi:hypothetical protein
MNFIKLTTKSLQNKLISKNVNKIVEPYLLTTCVIGGLGGMTTVLTTGTAFDICKKVFPKDDEISQICKGFIIVPVFWASIFGFGIIGCVTGPITVPLMLGYIPYKLYKKN